MNTMEIIMTRKSFRTFNGKKISEEDKSKLLSYTSTIDNPYNIPVDFVFLDGEEFDLSSPVIEGEDFLLPPKYHGLNIVRKHTDIHLKKWCCMHGALALEQHGLVEPWIGKSLKGPHPQGMMNI